MADLPLACTLSSEALKAHRENLLGALLQRSMGRTELADGVRLQFVQRGDRPTQSLTLP